MDMVATRAGDELPVGGSELRKGEGATTRTESLVTRHAQCSDWCASSTGEGSVSSLAHSAVPLKSYSSVYDEYDTTRRTCPPTA